MSVLYRGGTVHSAAAPRATALRVSGGRITWLGDGGDAPAADRVVDLDGGLVTAAFVDAHVHATSTGLNLSGLDLTGVRSAGEVLAAVERAARDLPAGGVLLGHGWDESVWESPRLPSAHEIGVAAGGRRVYLSQISVHSALVSSALLAADPAVSAAAGFDSSGWLRVDAHHVVRDLALASVTPEQRRRAQRVALRHAASLGIGAVHECGGPRISSEDDFTDVLAAGGPAHGHPEVFGYWGELSAAAKARDLGAVGAGGDLFADGALGSRTAFLARAYADEPGNRGHGYLTAEEVRDHLLDCHTHGVQGGFHAIGDAAIGAVLAGIGEVAERIGNEAVRAARHRIEHAELLDRTLIARMVEHGVVASVQPAFDRLWGGEGRMYAARLGAARALTANPLAAMLNVGVPLAFGSDAPVTPLDPWGAVRAAVRHHTPHSRMSVRAAFAAHTRGGWRALPGVVAGGAVEPGAPATFAVWDGVADLAAAVAATPVCRRTVVHGDTIHEA
ncbi:putative amidohydrolase YtcJ [Catenuloplanes nepalensis]|uniref:Amidohydrolase YtcJ n=1 Tax=Catenuloplanes nepalensis TaxID=587533 RepID=A0ABT9MSJ5_9ACTN|nr:amidohydrolase family protein [Catenuloplanes nepalensis]MDP9794412.1 putative amidohydrolase YtcJ [Catenuloplanes nepalensis]